jgi:hypothetical protein
MNAKPCSEQLKAGDHLDGLGLKGRIILKCNLHAKHSREIWIHLAHNWN